MSRSTDLDIIAPDDKIAGPAPEPEAKNITPAQPSELPSPPVSPSPVVEAHSTPVPHTGFNDPNFTKKVYNILGHTHGSFSSFLVKPDVFNFGEKDDEEEIVLVLRPHWFTNVSWILTAIAMLFVPTLLQFVPLLSGFSPKYQFVSVFFWYLVTFAFSFEKFLSWYFDVYIITTERVIDFDFYNLLDKKFSEAGLTMIQDVTSRVSGVSQTVFNYGNVLIQTAAEINEIHFEKVPNPDKIIRIISELRQAEEAEHDGNHHNGGVN
jgi:hypothetical protein